MSEKDNRWQATLSCTSITAEYVADDYGHTYPSGTYIFGFNDDDGLTVRDGDKNAYKIGEKYHAVLERKEFTQQRTVVVSVGEEES